MVHAETKRAEVRIVVVWLALVALTVVARLESQQVATVVLVVTMAKVWLVVHHYMEIGKAPLWLKALCDGWIVAVLVMLYLLVVDGGRIIGLS
nr:cytochrome C oxidase subunit IV family protein [Kibdelosporangium sp. MJ126-NF4]CEL22466.1 hypothetical protein [Kibdelosporangium sp. MJ126-NF4]CTQ89322.1 hypothetical protein [Kibdelosporangium sp. MJ126-NF4]